MRCLFFFSAGRNAGKELPGAHRQGGEEEHGHPAPAQSCLWKVAGSLMRYFLHKGGCVKEFQFSRLVLLNIASDPVLDGFFLGSPKGNQASKGVPDFEKHGSGGLGRGAQKTHRVCGQ